MKTNFNLAVLKILENELIRLLVKVYKNSLTG